MRALVLTIVLASVWCAMTVRAQFEVRTEAQVTATSGDYTPLWLNANKYGLSSLDKTNGYVRAGAFRPIATDSLRRLAWGAGLDMAVAGGFTSTLVVQQAYGELRWLKGLLTVGSKEHPMELKSQELSSGSQTLGINARPVPMVRLSLPEYWLIPGTKGWLGLKGHIAYGLTTDDNWQKDFSTRKNTLTDQHSRYTEGTLLHTKAGYLRIGKEDKPFTAELGVEMGCQFGGKSHMPDDENSTMYEIKNELWFKSMIRAFVPGGHDKKEDNVVYKNTEGNHLGSYVVRLNYDLPTWGASLYADHYFEDQSSMFFLDYDGYGTGDNWDVREKSRYFLYDLKDIMLGLEIRMKRVPWIDHVVVEYLYTKYQSGPVYHDHTKNLSTHISGMDNYYNHNVFTGWQHWGQVMGNPLYLSPLYNDDGSIVVRNNRFVAWHFGMSGNISPLWHYRVLATTQKGYGSYYELYPDPRRNFSMLGEVNCLLPWEGWSVKGAVGFDSGEIYGKQVGFQLTVVKKMAF